MRRDLQHRPDTDPDNLPGFPSYRLGMIRVLCDKIPRLSGIPYLL